MSVKLVAEVGVGTVAAGVAKAHADKVLISGDSGGTGASPLSSIKYAGIPWELGLGRNASDAGAQRSARPHPRRDRRADEDRARCGHCHVAGRRRVSALRPRRLIVEGCIMMRKCHLNTCPVGIATQDPELAQEICRASRNISSISSSSSRKKLRQLMAKLGFRTVNEMVGRVDKLKVTKAVDHWKAKGLDLTPLLTMPDVGPEIAALLRAEAGSRACGHSRQQAGRACQPAIEKGEKVTLDLPIRNVNRTVGTMLSSRIAKKYGLGGIAGGHDLDQVYRFSRTIVRGLPCQRHHADVGRRVQRLYRQRTLRRQDHRFSAEACALYAGRDHSDRQHVALWRDARGSLFLWHGGRTVCRAEQRRRAPSSKALAITAANT